MRVFFLFLDGVGLGPAEQNPFAHAKLPTLTALAGGQPWLFGAEPHTGETASFRPIDATLGVEGRPQSATGQATLLSGVNVPAATGGHYGPKPTDAIRAILDEHNSIADITGSGRTGALLNAYPSGFFERLESGKMLLSSNQYGLRQAGIAMRDGTAFYEGQALSVDFTGEMWFRHVAANDAAYALWRDKMGHDEPLTLSPREAGRRMAMLAKENDFTFFDQWLTDYIGHRGTLEEAVALLEKLDAAVAGILDEWDTARDMVLITSDHGNIEAIEERTHTHNPVPLLIIGADHAEAAAAVRDLADVAGVLRGAFGLQSAGM
ncbi:MAG: hypothetical protein GYB64_00670 [Chloroflexi bacterium]|nr:hypothetical protein [Chloroflexota bacterium]